ncbi:transmembrane protein [Cryptosporidium felis]|nr:transmembrane protein [Cryptosporidium felis]
MEVNNPNTEGTKDLAFDIRTPSTSTFSPPSGRFFDARSWEENKDVVSLRIQSPASELYLDEEFSPCTIIGSPNSIVDIRTPPKPEANPNGVQGEEMLENDICHGSPNEDSGDKTMLGGIRPLFSLNRLLYVIFTVIFGFIFVVGILGAFFYFGRYSNWSSVLLDNLEFNVESIFVKFSAEDGFEKMETSLLVKISDPTRENLRLKTANVMLSLENSVIEWNSLPIATVTSPHSLDIFQSDKLDVAVQTTSNSTNMLGISGILQDIITKGFTGVTVNSRIKLPGQQTKQESEVVSKKFTISMPLRELITNIQLSDISLDRDSSHNSNILFRSRTTYDYRGRIFVSNLGKVFFGVFHKNNYLGVLKIEDSDILTGKKSEISLLGTLNMYNFIRDEAIVRSLRPSLDFGESSGTHIPIKIFDLDIHGVGSSSILMDSAVRSARTTINLAVLPPPPLRQIPIPNISVNSVTVTPQLLVKIKGTLRTTFYGYLTSNGETPKIEALGIKGLLDGGGQFVISSGKNFGDFTPEGIANQIPSETSVSNGNANTAISEAIQNRIQGKQEVMKDSSKMDGVPFNTVTISPYTDNYDVPIDFELMFEDFSQAFILNQQRSILNAMDVQILTTWSFFTGRHSEFKNFGQARMELEMFSFLPKILEFGVKDGVFQAQITLQLIHLGDFDHGETSFNGPLKVTWLCNREFGSEFLLSNVEVNQIAANYILNSSQLIPNHCTLENSKLKVEILTR